jgi:hypothetical protein
MAFETRSLSTAAKNFENEKWWKNHFIFKLLTKSKLWHEKSEH